MSLSKLGEAKRLHAMGFAIHWLRPNSKVPVESGWTDDKPRDTIKELVKKYQKGFNVGVKLGEPSLVNKKYLSAIDVDIKGTNPKYRRQAIEWIEKNIPGLFGKTPSTLSGRGNGSMHIWVLVDEPMESHKLTSSSEIIEVHMPSTKASRADVEALGKKKTDAGWRRRPAWEVDFMCAGRQVVLPPSIHPDSGKNYRWGKPIEEARDIKFVDLQSLFDDIPKKKSDNGRPRGSSPKKDFDITDPDEMVLERRLKPEVIAGIYEGEGVEDRSAYCLTIALSMVRAKFKDADILGVLTNSEYFIGSVAYEHAKTSNRQRAARWVQDYCIAKARKEADASFEFDCEVKIYNTLSKEKAEKQLKRVTTDLGQVDWKKKLDRTDQDKVKPTFKNLKLIITNIVGANTFVFNEFSRHQTYGLNTPWGGVAGQSIEDVDEVRIKDWFANSQWKIEPNTNLVGEVITQICTSNSFHPVKDYLESLAWDGEPRLSTWMQTYLGAVGDETYLSAVSKKFLVAAVARIYEPGRKFDHMPIIEGMQGKGKSTVGRILAGEKWFYDSELNLHDKDSALNLQGQWIIEMGELANINRADVRTIKSFVVRQVDKVRPPYGKRMIESARQCVFFGTTNDDSYLKDKTGNRRFWPIEIPDDAEIDLEGLKRDRDQLWAEAMIAYECGETLYLAKDVESLAKVVQESRVVEDASDGMLDRIRGWKIAVIKARKAHRKNTGKKPQPLRFKLGDLFEEFSSEETGVNIPPPLKDYKPDNNAHLQWAATALRKLGFEKYASNGRNWWRFSTNK